MRHPLVELHRQHLLNRHLMPLTVKHQIMHIEMVLAWLPSAPDGGRPDLRDVQLQHLLDYYEYLRHRPKRGGGTAGDGYRHAQIHAIKGFYSFLKTRRKILIDPFIDFPVLRKPQRLPKGVITDEQVMRWMSQPNLSTPTGFRDRTLMEVFYSTGLRGAELCKLTAYDVNIKDRTVRVIMGKGRRDRMVPIGKAALGFVAEYLDGVRPLLLAKNRGRSVERLFLTNRGAPITTNVLRRILMQYRDAARLPRSVTVHSLRHACATEMLKGGANVRHVQEMLGHTTLVTTQVYTRVVPSDLKRIHKITAPSERRRVIDVPTFEQRAWRDKKNRSHG
jgi:integrase/recombinase XerD